MEFFAKLPEVVLMHPGLSANAVRLYCIVLRRAGDRRWFYDGMPRLAELMNLSPSSTKTVRQALTELEKVNAVRVHRTIKPNGHHGGNRYTVLPVQGITGVDAVAAHDRLGNSPEGLDSQSTDTAPDPWSDDPTPWSDDPEPRVKQPSRPDSPREPPEISAAPPSAAPSTAAPPDGAAMTRDDYRYLAQWQARPSESSEDRAIRLVARALTSTHGREVLPDDVRATVLDGKYDYQSLGAEQALLCDAVDSLREFNTEHARGDLNMRLNDDELLGHLERAMRSDDLPNLWCYLEGVS